MSFSLLYHLAYCTKELYYLLVWLRFKDFKKLILPACHGPSLKYLQLLHK
jgi:hypothetical protein